MVGLFTGVLLLAMLPGVTVAKVKVDTSECKKGGWSYWVRQDQTAFADQAECVAYVAEGGTLADPTPPATFQSVCVENGGTSTWVPRLYMGNSTAPNCEWGESIDFNTWVHAVQALEPYCTGEPDAWGFYGQGEAPGGIPDPGEPWAFYGCYPS